MLKRESAKSILWGCLIPAVVLIGWQAASTLGWISAQLFPPPLTILKSFFEVIASGELGMHLQTSVMRAMLGFVIGGGSGLIIGLFVGLFKRSEQMLDPTIQMLRTVPLLAITPLFILWFGFGELSKVLLISMGAFFPMYVNAFLGVRNVDAKLFDVSRVLEFTRLQQVTKVILPGAMPNVLLGVRLSLSTSWLCLVVAELMGADRGVGYLIQDARAYMRTDIVFVGIIVFAAAGKLSDSLVRWLERRLLRWQDSYRG